MVSRLQSVSLMVTSLMTSLHDTTISGLNNGFKEATNSFKKLMNDTKDILDVVNDDTNIRNTLEILEDIMEILTDDTMTVAGLTITGIIVSTLSCKPE